MSKGVRCMWMRGGTSKGGYFLKEDLPPNEEARDAFLLRVMGSPDPRQIDGMGGADPLTSKVAIVSKSNRPNVDVEYLFLQVSVNEASVSGAQNCGNLLAGVGPFAIERGLIEGQGGETLITIHMVNTGQKALATLETPSGRPVYHGQASIDGVPGSAAPIRLEFEDTAGSSCGALLPTGNTVDTIDGIDVTLIDNGMPCVLVQAKDVGATGYESREELDGADALKARVEALRLKAGPLMNLGDVTHKTVPKMMLLAPPRRDGAICARSFIPHRAHASIGVFAAVSVASGCVLEGSVAAPLARIDRGQSMTLSVEHPSGETSCVLTLGPEKTIKRAGLLRTARKLMEGEVFG
ncbi:MAG: 4-oxalomesaconate tautomerase [Pseudomonadota bacterium]